MIKKSKDPIFVFVVIVIIIFTLYSWIKESYDDYQNQIKLNTIITKMPANIKYIQYNRVSPSKKGILKSKKLKNLIVKLLNVKKNPDLPVKMAGGGYYHIEFTIFLHNKELVKFSLSIDSRKSVIYAVKRYKDNFFDYTIDDKNFELSREIISILNNE